MHGPTHVKIADMVGFMEIINYLWQEPTILKCCQKTHHERNYRVCLSNFARIANYSGKRWRWRGYLDKRAASDRKLEKIKLVGALELDFSSFGFTVT